MSVSSTAEPSRATTAGWAGDRAGRRGIGVLDLIAVLPTGDETVSWCAGPCGSRGARRRGTRCTDPAGRHPGQQSVVGSSVGTMYSPVGVDNWTAGTRGGVVPIRLMATAVHGGDLVLVLRAVERPVSVQVRSGVEATRMVLR